MTNWPGPAIMFVRDRICVTAAGDETFGELKIKVAEVLPPGFEVSGGLDRTRIGEPKLLGGVWDADRQALVCFDRHHAPRTAPSPKDL